MHKPTEAFDLKVVKTAKERVRGIKGKLLPK